MIEGFFKGINEVCINITKEKLQLLCLCFEGCHCIYSASTLKLTSVRFIIERDAFCT